MYEKAWAIRVKATDLEFWIHPSANFIDEIFGFYTKIHKI